MKKNPESLKEKNLFKNSKIVQNLIKELEEMFVMNKFTFEDVELMYTICAYETAWRHNPKNPWCYGFDEPKYKIMEFLEDLEYYYIDGYGHEITKEICCHTAEDLLEKLE